MFLCRYFRCFAVVSRPTVQKALQAGDSLRAIHKSLNESGLTITYRRFTAYRPRIERANDSQSAKPLRPGSSLKGNQNPPLRRRLFYRARGHGVKCVDTDPVNQTFSQHAGIGAQHLKLMSGNQIDRRRFGDLIEEILSSGESYMVDNGAATFLYEQDGVQVAWSRIIFPGASSLDLNGMVGLDSNGNSGLRDKVNYGRLIGFSAPTSLFTAAFEISQSAIRVFLLTRVVAKRHPARSAEN
jgi:hypothetical protein